MKTIQIAAPLAVVLAFASSALGDSSVDRSLQEKVEALTVDFRGEVGLYVRHLGSGQTVAVDADKLFPTASMIKVPIAVGIYDKVEKGELALDELLTFDPEKINYPPGECLVAALRTGEKVRLKKLVHLMLSLSDNHASLWLQDLAGKGMRINQIMEELGFDQIKVNSRTDGREGDRQKYGWGQTTPKQMGELLAAIHEGRVVSPWASESLYRFLTASAFHGEAIAAIPPFVQSATKQGAVSHARSEVVLVNAPSGDYVFCVATQNQEDRSWDGDNAGFLLIRSLSRVLWEHFEPDHPWQPAAPAEASARADAN